MANNESIQSVLSKKGKNGKTAKFQPARVSNLTRLSFRDWKTISC